MMIMKKAIINFANKKIKINKQTNKRRVSEENFARRNNTGRNNKSNNVNTPTLPNIAPLVVIIQQSFLWLMWLKLNRNAAKIG